MKKIVIQLLFMIAILLPSCEKNEENKDIFLVLKTLNNPFFADIESGAKKEITEEYNLMVRAGQSESDITFQRKILDIIAKKSLKNKISGLILSPCSSGSELLPYLKKIHDANVPIILIDTKISLELLDKYGISNNISYIGSSNREGGLKAGEYLNRHNAKEILILNGVEGQESAEERKNGFKHAMGNSNITERTANWNRMEAQKITSSFIAGGKNFDAIFAANDEMALGALRAYNASESGQKKKPLIVGFDAIFSAKQSIKERDGLSATIAQDPVAMGKEAVRQIEDYNLHQIPLHDKFIPTQLISKDE